MSDPSNSNAIGTNNTVENQIVSGIHTVFGDDGSVLEDIWKSSMKSPDLQTEEERFAVISDNLKRIDELARKWVEEGWKRTEEKYEREEVERKRQETYSRNKQRQRELKYERGLPGNAEPWYKTLFQVTLPGQIYSLYSYLKSSK